MNTKFTLLILTALTIAVASNAQINKGSTALGGNLNFSTSTTKDDGGFNVTVTDFLISPSLMIIYTNNHAVGFNLNYGHQQNSYFNQRYNSYGAGAFLRQYKPLGKGFYVFAQESLNFNYNKGNSIQLDSLSNVDDKSFQISFTANPGIAYDLSKTFQLELLLFNNLLSANYTHSTITSQSSAQLKSDVFAIGANLDASQLTSINVGAKIFFRR